MGQFALLIKTLIKSSLDNYVLPGTLSGTEVLWLYMIHWKRAGAKVLWAVLWLFISSAELTEAARVFSVRSAGESGIAPDL